MNEITWKSRWPNDQLRAMLIEQFESIKQRDTGILRTKLNEVEKAVQIPHTVIITGLRRVGKSTLLAQIAHRLGFAEFYYVNFEDDRFLGFQAEDATVLFRMLVETFGDRKIFLIDEIQNIQGWEYFVRRFMDLGYKFFITGSNASLLSQELGTLLTGRYVSVELFPFSFREFLHFKEYVLPDLERMTTVDQARINAALNAYLVSGGIPDALKYPELQLLRTLYDDVLYRDIATRYRLDAITALKEMAFFLISNPSGLISYNKLKERLRLGSVNTVSSYVEYMKNSWLIFILNLHAYSVKRKQLAPKKVFCIDTGIVNSVGYHFSPNTAKLIENLVYLTLRQQNKEIYYLQTPGGYEIDFYLPRRRQIIQVAQRLDSPSTREREFRAIEDALKETNIESAIILSDANREETLLNNIPIKVESVSEWLIKAEY